MTGELVRVNNGQAALTDVALGMADMLNPLGAARDIVVALSACAVEIGNFRLEKKRLHLQHAIASDIVATRQGAIIQFFEVEKRRSYEESVTVQDVRTTYRMISLQACNMQVSMHERLFSQETVRMLTTDLVRTIVVSGDTIVRLSDSLQLGSIATSVNAWRQVNQ